MTTIYVDADACPVKDEVVRVAERHGSKVFIVTNGGVRPIRHPLVEMTYVPSGPDVADDWIAERIAAGHICVTADIPLAGRCVKAGADVLKPNGDLLDEKAVGMAVAMRDLMTGLRETGAVSGYNAGFTKADRSRFLQSLDRLLTRSGR